MNSSGDKETKDIADLLTAVVQNRTNGLNYEQKDIEKVRDIIQDILREVQSKVDARLGIADMPLSGSTVSVWAKVCYAQMQWINNIIQFFPYQNIYKNSF